MRDQDVDLSCLRDFVNKFLSSTENVKRILEAECEEARYVLRPWPIEMTITKENDESCCTCDSKSSLEDHVEEIVEGIGRALSQAQELREKIAINVSKQKRKLREPSLQRIYMPTSVNNASKVAAKKGQSTRPQKASTKATSSEATRGTAKEANAIGRKSLRGKITESKTSAENKLLKLSTGNTMIPKDNSKPAKNFVAANKSNAKNCKRLSKSTVDLPSVVKKSSDTLSPLSGTSQTLSGCSSSIAELNNLMDRVSINARKKGSSASCLQSGDRREDCPRHGENAQQFVEERIRTTVDMIEGLDKYGVPGDVVRTLKMYQSYLHEELDDEGTDKKGRRAANRFLMEFDKMNEDRCSKRTTDPLANLTVDLSSLFRDTHSLTLVSAEEKSSITHRYAEVDSRSKSCHLKKFDPVEFRKPKVSTTLGNENSETRGWSSNGVWNRAVIPSSFAGINRALSIRYANKGQLLSFFENNQRLQQLLYHRDLMELLLTKLIPDVRQNFDPNSTEYCEAYKMIFTIAQVLNPRFAVLVRTDV